MGNVGGSGADYDLLVAGKDALVAEQLKLSRRLYRLTGALHTFAPRRHIGDGQFEIEWDEEEAQWRGLNSLDSLNARNKYMQKALEEMLGLKEPFPISPFKAYPSRFGFTIQNVQGNYLFKNFHAEYAAKHFLDKLLEGKTFKWINRRLIHCDDGMTIKGENDTDLEIILDYEFKGKEAQWVIPEPYMSYALKLSGKIAFKQVPQDEPSTPREPTVKREPKPSIERPDGLTPLSDIADELGIDPRDARQILRKHSEKPTWGWAWPSDAIDKVRQILKKNRT
jgi:hypothetical protein